MLRFLLLALVIFLVSAGAGGRAFASCECACVEGKTQAVCSSSIDIKPICPARVCPIAPPSVRPITPPTVPPVGASNCRMEQVYDQSTHRYEYKKLCR